MTEDLPLAAATVKGRTGRASGFFGPGVARGSVALLAQVQEGASHAKSTVKCDALLVDTVSRSDTYPYVDVREDDVEMGTRPASRRSPRTSCST